MHSMKLLYKIGNGPSSSHTMGPKLACETVINKYKDADYFKVILMGSLALTGKGHLTDYIITKAFNGIKHDIEFDYKNMPVHPNTMIFMPYKGNQLLATLKVLSVGGGAIRFEGDIVNEPAEVYKLNTLDEILKYCEEKKIRLYDYVYECEPDIKEYLELIYEQMLSTVSKGLDTTGVIHGKLKITRKANFIYNKSIENESHEAKRRRLLCAYAYAVSEENACGGLMVTAPTCGASGVLPAVLKYAIDENKYTHIELINALATAGLIGNLVKKNGSISGAEAGCQAEIGTACAMAAAFYQELQNDKLDKVARASEIALEHHLGLTCDPIDGYVQIPCIERNAVAAMRAIDAQNLATLIPSGQSKISFDVVVKTMLQTGRDLAHGYRETSEGGLARIYYGE